MSEEFERYKSVGVIIQFDSSQMIQVSVEDNEATARELVELARGLVKDVIKFARERGGNRYER